METSPDYCFFTDIQLLELLCSAENDGLIFSEFVRRFLPDVNFECEKICNQRKLDKHVGKQIAHETFERVRKYKSFKSDKINLEDDRKAVLVYLFKVSTSLFNDYHRKEKYVVPNHRTYFEDLVTTINPKIDVKELKMKHDIASQLFNKLNKKEQRVVLTDLEYKKHHKYLPDDVTYSLATELGVKVPTVRKIRERAIDKLKNAINEINES